MKPEPVPLQFREAIDYFKSKVRLPTNAWTDLWQEQHTKAFVVAGAVKRGLLEDMQSALASALENGTTLADFRKEFDTIVTKHGWTYKGSRGWRSRVIFETNLRTSYAAGQWRQIERTKKTRPYLRYVDAGDSRVRPQHHAWHGLVYPVDHEFWDTHYPPNGWGCRCRVQTLSERDIRTNGYNVSSALPPGGMVSRPVTGGGKTQMVSVPAGIDPGWGYNVGRNRLSGLTPPPAPGGPGPGIGPAATAAMPTPRSFPAAKLLPKDGMTNEEYASAFLKEFGADVGKPKVFNDVTGEALPISDALLKETHSDRWKVTKAGRQVFLRMLAAGIKEPDEVWFDWFRDSKTGRYQLRRRYISRFDISGKQQTAYTVFEVTGDGWREVTNFAPKAGRRAEKQDEYMETFRRGHLVYRRQ